MGQMLSLRCGAAEPPLVEWNEKCPWTTVAAALEAIEELLPDADDCGRAILTEYAVPGGEVLAPAAGIPLGTAA